MEELTSTLGGELDLLRFNERRLWRQVVAAIECRDSDEKIDRAHKAWFQAACALSEAVTPRPKVTP